MSLFLNREKEDKKQTSKTSSKPKVKKFEGKEREEPKCTADKKTSKQFLGKLYVDIEYLEKLLKDESIEQESDPTSRMIKDKACDGLEYLYSRAEFWREQKPVNRPSRKWDNDRKLEAIKRKENEALVEDIVRRLEEIDKDLAEGRYEASLGNAKNTLDLVERSSDKDIPNSTELLANLHCRIGNAYLEMGNTDQALEHQKLELILATEHGLADVKARTLDNLGRTHAKNGDFEKAIEIWQEKVPYSQTALEKTWLYHEMGWSYFELNKFSDARDYGEKSIRAAREADDLSWQLHATVLVAQSEAHLEDYTSATASFKKALEIARKQNDSQAEHAIQTALEEINKPNSIGEEEEAEDDEESEADIDTVSSVDDGFIATS